MPENSLDLYVPPAGDDAWSGLHPDPSADGTVGPFATLEAARDALRERRRAGTATADGSGRLPGSRWSHLDRTTQITPAPSRR